MSGFGIIHPIKYECGSDVSPSSRVVTRHRRSGDVNSLSSDNSRNNSPRQYERKCRKCMQVLPSSQFAPSPYPGRPRGTDQYCFPCRELVEQTRAQRLPIDSGDGTYLIPLTRGEYAIIDAADIELVSRRLWCFVKSPKAQTGYAASELGLMHRCILDADKDLEVDHIDGNGLNNTRSNLRLCSKAENGRNRQALKVDKTSRFKGVSWDRRDCRWVAYIMVNKKRIWLGGFSDEVSAAEAYDKAALRYFGAFARLNLPDDGGTGAGEVAPGGDAR